MKMGASGPTTSDFESLHGAEPPCIQALVRQGGLPTESFEASAKALASYCIAACPKPSRIQLLAVRLSEGFVGHTSRNTGQRQRYTTHLCQQQPESVASFTCERMRGHRADEDSLRFDCGECAASPD